MTETTQARGGRLMKALTGFAVLVSLAMLTSCNEEWPESTVVHLAGVVSSLPGSSQWPADVSVGTLVDYWLVLPNDATDTDATSQRGAYDINSTPPGWYTLRIGPHALSIDELPAANRRFQVIVNTASEPRYQFVVPFHTTFGALPRLHAASIQVKVASAASTGLSSDRLRLLPIDSSVIGGQILVSATGADGSDQPMVARINRYEVFEQGK